jgi:hypothetical protein
MSHRIMSDEKICVGWGGRVITSEKKIGHGVVGLEPRAWRTISPVMIG